MTNLYFFTGGNDGATPNSALIQGNEDGWGSTKIVACLTGQPPSAEWKPFGPGRFLVGEGAR